MIISYLMNHIVWWWLLMVYHSWLLKVYNDEIMVGCFICLMLASGDEQWLIQVQWFSLSIYWLNSYGQYWWILVDDAVNSWHLMMNSIVCWWLTMVVDPMESGHIKFMAMGFSSTNGLTVGVMLEAPPTYKHPTGPPVRRSTWFFPQVRQERCNMWAVSWIISLAVV